MYNIPLFCCIETPQFRPDGTIKTLQRQYGYFYQDYLLFVPSMFSMLGHDVRFTSVEQFLKHLVI